MPTLSLRILATASYAIALGVHYLDLQRAVLLLPAHLGHSEWRDSARAQSHNRHYAEPMALCET